VAERDKYKVKIPPEGITVGFLKTLRQPRVIQLSGPEETVTDVMGLVNSLFSASGWNSGRIGEIDLFHDLLMTSDVSFEVGRLRMTFFKVTLPGMDDMHVFYIATKSIIIGHGIIQYLPYRNAVSFRYSIHDDKLMPADIGFKIAGQDYGKEALVALMVIGMDAYLFDFRPVDSFVLAEGSRAVADALLPDLWKLRRLMRTYGNFKDTEYGLEFRIKELLPHEECSGVLQRMLRGQI